MEKEWNKLIDQWSEIGQQIKLDATEYDSILMDKIVDIETDIHMFIKHRIENNLEIIPQMKMFRSITEVWKEEIKRDIPSQIPENAPPVEPIIDFNGTLYALSDELRQEHKDGEHKWAKTLNDLFKWAEHKYTYSGGEKFKAKNLVTSFHNAKVNNKL